MQCAIAACCDFEKYERLRDIDVPERLANLLDGLRCECNVMPEDAPRFVTQLYERLPWSLEDQEVGHSVRGVIVLNLCAHAAMLTTHCSSFW